MESTRRERPDWAYRAILLAATIIWGLGFVIGKYAIAAVGATWFTAIRFLGSGVVLLLLFLPRFRRHLDRKLLKAGVVIGVFSALGFWTQFMGLGLTTPAKNAFLSTCYCLTVPFIWWAVARRRPAGRTFRAAAICTVGVALVSLQGGLAIGAGDAMSILSAFAYGLEIVSIGIMMRDNDVLSVTIVQQFAAGAFTLVAALALEPVPSAQVLAEPAVAGALAYVIVLSASFGAVAQNLAQSKVPPAEAGILLSLESVFCAIFSALLAGEVFTPQMLAGFCLIFLAIIIAQRQGA